MTDEMDTPSISSLFRKRKTPSYDRFIAPVSDSAKGSFKASRGTTQQTGNKEGSSNTPYEEFIEHALGISLTPNETIHNYTSNSGNNLVASNSTRTSTDSSFKSPTRTPSKQHSRQIDDLKRIMKTPTKKTGFPFLDSVGSPDSNYHGSLLGPLLRRGSVNANSSPVRNSPPDLENVLDAPGCRDDYYIDVLDWGVLGTLMVGLDDRVYLWNQRDSGVHLLCESDNEADYVSACAFSPQGHRAAVSTELGFLSIFDIRRVQSNAFDPIRSYYFVDHGVSALRFIDNNHIVTGDRTGGLHHWDLRHSNNSPTVSRSECHLDRIVSIAVHPNKLQFATGGNGHIVNVWDVRNQQTPMFVLDHHSSAVRALDWCPWEHNILATGGGLDDGRICIIDTHLGKMVKSTETGFQICKLIWSRHYKEIVSLASTDAEQIEIRRYPDIDSVALHFKGHNARPLHSSLSPDGQVLATMSGDETVKLWRCFPVRPDQRPLKPYLKEPKSTVGTIR